ncbi:MAG: hypothetical protein ABJC39_02260 [Chloroflexota bacterium]
MSETTRAALTPVLDPTERVMRVAAAVGCTLVLTDRRLHVVRDGADYRPRTGIRSWTLDRALTVRLMPVRKGTGRLVIDRSGGTASIFLTIDQTPFVEALLAEIRRRIYREL